MTPITNRYAGKCGSCGRMTPAGGGTAEKTDTGWVVTCTPCETGETPTPAPAAKPIAERPTFDLTDEQVKAVELFAQGQSIAIQAGAGTGKTSTLVAIAKSTTRLGQYVAFNKAIVTDAKAKLPSTCAAATAHSLAFRQVGRLYAHRLDSGRMRSEEIARRLHIEPFFWTFDEARKVIQPKTLAGYVMQAISRFCNSADEAPGTTHMPYIDGIDMPLPGGQRTWANNDAVREHCTRAIRLAWEDLTNVHGVLRFSPDCYLKMWQLGTHGPAIIPGDYILFDEAQDASPVMLAVVAAQGKQVVFVGDAQQQIYEWRGAVDAMTAIPSESTTYLTHSWRFGEGIATVANKILGKIPSARLRLTGRGDPSIVEHCPTPDAVLCRTNAGAIQTVLAAQANGQIPHLVGGGGEFERFAKGAKALMAGQSTDHPELACFDDWKDVQAYVIADPQGTELALMVGLIDDYGIDLILKAVSNMVAEQDADVVVSTAHKAKGREWNRVRIHSDFRQPIGGADSTDPEHRLLYVACTRARRHLDLETSPLAVAIVFPERAGASQEAPRALPPANRPAIAPALAAPLPQLIERVETARHAQAIDAPWSETRVQTPLDVKTYIGRCEPGCKHAVKVDGVLVMEGRKFVAFLDGQGHRIQLPSCPEHHKRPFMRELIVKPARPGSKCNASCWNAKKAECDCVCQGRSHGQGHYVEVTAPPDPDPEFASMLTAYPEIDGPLSDDESSEYGRPEASEWFR